MLYSMNFLSPFVKQLKTKSSVQIALQNGLSDRFHDNIGVKHGCVLSPTLFKILISKKVKIVHVSGAQEKMKEIGQKG